MNRGLREHPIPGGADGQRPVRHRDWKAASDRPAAAQQTNRAGHRATLAVAAMTMQQRNWITDYAIATAQAILPDLPTQGLLFSIIAEKVSICPDRQLLIRSGDGHFLRLSVPTEELCHALAVSIAQRFARPGAIEAIIIIDLGEHIYLQLRVRQEAAMELITIDTAPPSDWMWPR